MADLDERYVFKPATRRKLLILLVVGLALAALGLVLAMTGHHEEEASNTAQQLTASIDPAAVTNAASEHEGSASWLRRIYASLWMNNVLFCGFGVIGLFFVAIQYAASAGWSAGMKRVPLAMAQWIPFAGVLMLVLWFISKGDLFHWVHADLYDKSSAKYDEILYGKEGYFFWPGKAGGFPIFYIGRMILFFAVWYLFFTWIKREMMAEDLDADVKHWYKARKLSAMFLVFFAVSCSVGAWDWIMTIDPHWYSTMFGWYTFASWWVSTLAVITLLVVYLKEAGYLKIVNANHLHDLGKFIFAFSIFWTYVWFGQFLLIYYANIPEETVYFINRMRTAPYGWIFYVTLVANFFLPFLLLMTRDAKRHMATLKVICPIVIIGHWFDFYNLVTPGVVKVEGGVGFLEIGITLVFLAAFLWVTLTSLAGMPLIGKNHPMLEESLHHDI